MAKRQKRDIKHELMLLIKRRIRSLGGTKQIYENNPNIPNNVKIANSGLVQNEIESLVELFSPCP